VLPNAGALKPLMGLPRKQLPNQLTFIGSCQDFIGILTSYGFLIKWDLNLFQFIITSMLNYNKSMYI
jgi:hypothetical protein